MKERDINAYFDNDAIYVTNEQDDEMDMIEDIIHEISHASNTTIGILFMETETICKEKFIAKRRKRLSRLYRKNMPYLADFDVNFEYDEGHSTSFFTVTSDMTHLIRFVLVSFLLLMLLLR